MPRKGEFSENHGKIIELWRQGLNPAEIAARLGLKFESVYGHIYRTRMAEQEMTSKPPAAVSAVSPALSAVAASARSPVPLNLPEQPRRKLRKSSEKDEGNHATVADGPCTKCAHHDVCRSNMGG